MEEETFVGGNEYLLSSPKLKLKEDYVTKWKDYKKKKQKKKNKTHKLSNLINDVKKRNYQT